MECKICNKNCNGLKGLSIHLKKKHNFDDIELKKYYDKHIKKDKEDKCYFCNGESIFPIFFERYHRICESKKCLGKTRATGTYEFLMYKYGLSKNDAIKLMEKRALERGKKIKNSLEKSFNENKNFFKERSHQTKEYWIKQGLNEEESIQKANEVMDMIHKKTWNKRRSNPDLYDDINTTQIKYWLKKGYNYDNAIMKRKERQSTFSLEICINKYGEEKGIKIWIERQHKWHKNYKKSNFSKISQELFWSIYNKINYDDKKNIKFATLKNGKLDDSGCNNEERLKLDLVILPDFINLESKKILEFNGVYYHRNNIENKKREIKRTSILIKNGYKVYNIKENDYKQNKEKVIQECIEFLKND